MNAPALPDEARPPRCPRDGQPAVRRVALNGHIGWECEQPGCPWRVEPLSAAPLPDALLPDGTRVIAVRCGRDWPGRVLRDYPEGPYVRFDAGGAGTVPRERLVLEDTPPAPMSAVAVVQVEARP